MSNNEYPDDELWCIIIDFPIYCISNHGRVYNIKSKQFRKASIKNQYVRINLRLNYKKKDIAVHRLVAIYFIDNLNNKKQVNHKDGNKINNHYSNLEWMTQSENVKHGIDTGLTKISVKPVLQFDKNMNMIEEYKSSKEVSLKIKCSQDSLQKICSSNELKLYYGFYWGYKYENYIPKPFKIIKKIPDFKNYSITEYGDIYSDFTKRFIKPNNNFEYNKISIFDKSYFIHRLVALTFHLESYKPNYIVNHKDGNKHNNHYLNLEWVTHSENIKHAIENNLIMNNGKKIIQFDLTGKYISSYKSLNEAFMKTKISLHIIRKSCNNLSVVDSKFIWKFNQDCLFENNVYKLKDKFIGNLVNKICLFNKDKQFIELFTSGNKCADYTQMNHKTVKKYCISKQPYNSHYFRFEQDCILQPDNTY